MYISKLKMRGFKSFADNTIISLDSGLNGIIGPNGSGKSNIVEAIKWVMGENSSKNLRGSGMNDVIFNGSASKASKNIAQVVLTIKVEEKNLSQANKKFIKSGLVEVERQILRDAGSTYRINGKEVKAKEVQFLFADFSSGSRASNIIDQGTVGNLVTQKPSERRKILDESAGISGITARKVESSNKLEATKRNLQRLSDILSSQRERLYDLRKQAEKAKSFKSNQRRIDDLVKSVSLAKINKSKNLLESVKDNYKFNSSQLVTVKEIEKKISTDLDTIKESIRKIEARKKELSEKNFVLQLNIEKVGYQISNNTKELDSLKNLEKQINNNILFQKDILENSVARIQSLKLRKNEFSEYKDVKSNFLIENNFGKMQVELSRHEQELLNFSNIYSSKKEDINLLNYSLNAKRKQQEENDKEILLLQKSITDFNKKSKSNSNYSILINRKKNLLRFIERCKKSINDETKSSKKIKVEIDKLSSDLSLVNKKERIINDRINSLEKELSSFTSIGFQNNSDNILKHISIQKGYELAFYLAVGDGIEASKDPKNNSPVVWKRIINKGKQSLPNEMKPLSNYVKAPTELEFFLSQVGIVTDKKHGDKLFNLLKNGQLAVTKEGSLWRWDGLHIKNGLQTIAYKRIISTTKIIEIEKKIKKENTLLKIHFDKKNNYEKLIFSQQKLLKNKIEKKEKNQRNLDHKMLELKDLENSILYKRNEIDKEKNEVTLKNNILKNKSNYCLNLKIEIEKIELKISKESSNIVNLKSKVSNKERKVNSLKENLDKQQIELAILKQKKASESLHYKKVLQEIKDTDYQIDKTKSTLNNLFQDLKKVSKNILDNKSRPKNLSSTVHNYKSTAEKNKKALISLEESLLLATKNKERLEEKLLKNKEKLDVLKETTLRKQIQKEDLSKFIRLELIRIKDELGIEPEVLDKLITKNSALEFDIRETEDVIKKLRIKNDLIGNVNLYAEDELNELEKKVDGIFIEEKDLIRASKKLEKAIEELNKEARKRVINTFAKMNLMFSKLFKNLFGGGKAYLELVESDDPLEAGLELMASPPGKKLQRLTLLSGGEKALASLALIFSTFINKTTPICILDEVDAPLDDANVEKFNRLLKEVSSMSDKRFIIITHNKITMSNMSQIFGVTMMEPGSSKIVSVNIDKQTSVFAAE